MPEGLLAQSFQQRAFDARAAAEARRRAELANEQSFAGQVRANPVGVVKAKALEGLTTAPDIAGMGITGLNAASNHFKGLFGLPEGDTLPGGSLSGDPIRELAGLDASDPAVIVGESLPGPSMLAKAGMTAVKGALASVPLLARTRKVGKLDRDPRFDPRVKEQDRLNDLTIQTERQRPEPDEVSIFDQEGKPFVTSMSDRVNAGISTTHINGVELPTPLRNLGGQGYMFEEPGFVWASGTSPVSNIMNKAREVKAATGQDPLFMPWRMAPTGGDFSSITGEAMLGFASASLGSGTKRSINARLKKVIPGWLGVDHPDSIAQFRAAPDKVRKFIKDKILDVQFRDKGGLSIGEARLAVADPTQLNAREGGLQNMGVIRADDAPTLSNHPAFPATVPGEGIGRLKEDISVFELLPDVVKGRGIPDPRMPRGTDNRSMQMGAKSGLLTEDILKQVELALQQ